MVDKGLVTVIVPVFNVEDYLEKCIKSIVYQTYSKLEIIIVDDGSMDNSPRICDKWALVDKRIHVIHKENGGLSDARNAALKIAAGNYISFVDSDDWVDQYFIEMLLDTLIEENADIVECGVAYVDKSDYIIKERKISETREIKNKIDSLRSLVKEDGVYQTVWNKLYKRSVIDSIYFEKEKYNEDDFWTYQIFDRSNKIVTISNVLYFYLQRNSSIMGSGYQIKRLDGLDARVRRMEYLQKYDELSDFTKANIFYDFMFHFQSALEYLEPSEQKIVTNYIINAMKDITEYTYKDSGVPKRYQIWFALFKRFPYLIAKIRNYLKIGI